jgi:predicted component of type VI protein secretion system
MAYLLVRTRGGQCNRQELRGNLTVGRSVECGLCLVDPRLSRQHCRIEQDEKAWVVEDLSSRNGTYVNGERVAGRQALCDGDEITVGSVLMRFEAVGFSGSRPQSPDEALLAARMESELEREKEQTLPAARRLPVPQPKALGPSRAGQRNSGESLFGSSAALASSSSLAFRRPPAKPVVKPYESPDNGQ